MKHLILLLFIVILYGCKLKFNDTVDLNGVWYEDPNGNASFTIDNNRIYYLDYSGNYYLKIKNSYIRIYEDSIFISKYKIEKVTKDSLFLRTEEDILLKYIKLN